MFSGMRSRANALAGLGAISAGLGCLLAATLLNVAHDRLGWSEGGTPPPLLDDIYAAAGKGGVTLLFSTLGVAIIALSVASRMTQVRAERRAAASASRPAPAAPYFYSESHDAPAAPTGRMVLVTKKYLPASAALSGVPGWSEMQRKRPGE